MQFGMFTSAEGVAGCGGGEAKESGGPCLGSLETPPHKTCHFDWPCMGLIYAGLWWLVNPRSVGKKKIKTKKMRAQVGARRTRDCTRHPDSFHFSLEEHAVTQAPSLWEKAFTSASGQHWFCRWFFFFFRSLTESRNHIRRLGDAVAFKYPAARRDETRAGVKVSLGGECVSPRT